MKIRLDREALADVIGVVQSATDVQTITGRATQKEFLKRDLVLVDEKAAITVSLWGKQVREKNNFWKRIEGFLRPKNSMVRCILSLLSKELKLANTMVVRQTIVIIEY